MVLGGTGLAVGVLAGALSFLSWDKANQVAGVVSALVSVAALGVAVWALVASPGGGSSVRVSGTGRATATGGGSANSGVLGAVSGTVEVDRTGDAQADGGRANTGFEQR
ncbi:hypothetical protein CFP65_5040 [Kitasatospora sp. MMS16-BH015]|nr:hypothetical protein CFP65_5040 [Kitasatospora sp. MMS16-BH015]